MGELSIATVVCIWAVALSHSHAKGRNRRKKERKTLAVFITYPTRDRRCVDDCLVLCVLADNASSISEM